jgi:hypothetical protein
MKCEHDIPNLKHFSFMEGVEILKKERNDLAKSRQQWIQAAFNLRYSGAYNSGLFEALVGDELCDSCIRQYTPENELIKTEI